MAAHCPDCPGIIKWKVFVTSEFYIFILLFLLKQDKTEKHKSGTFLLFNYPSLSDFVVMIKGEFFNGGRGLKLMKILFKKSYVFVYLLRKNIYSYMCNDKVES